MSSELWNCNHEGEIAGHSPLRSQLLQNVKLLSRIPQPSNYLLQFQDLRPLLFHVHVFLRTSTLARVPRQLLFTPFLFRQMQGPLWTGLGLSLTTKHEKDVGRWVNVKAKKEPRLQT